MGNDRTQQETPAPIEGPPSNTGSDEAPIPPSPKTILPKDLPTAIKHLDDRELDRLLGAAVDEARRRGRLPPGSMAPSAKTVIGAGERGEKEPLPKSAPAQRGPTEIAAPSLTRGQVNAVRAAFKAGIAPSRIARQFGLSQSDVRKALESDEAKR